MATPETIKQHPTAVGIAAIVCLFTMLGFARNLEWLSSKFDALITSGIVILPGNAGVRSKLWFYIFFVALVCALAAFGYLYIQAELLRREAIRAREDAVKNLDERRTIAFKTLMGMMRAASRIRDRNYPPASRPLRSFKSIKSTFEINKNFDGDVRQEYEIYSSDKPLHFVSLSEAVTDSADSVDYFDDIDFKVRDESGHEVVYLPTENDGRSKKVVLYFLPRIEPGDAPRKIIITYRWPRMFGQLDRLGEETFSWAPESRDPIELMEYSLFLEPGTGRNFACEKAGQSDAEETLDEATNVKGWSGFRYRVTNSGGYTRCALTAKLRRP